MTVPYETRPLAAATVPAAITTLRVRGLRVSSARRLVLEALFAADRPVSAEEIADGLGGRFPSSDLASVYRNLLTLEEVGLVKHFHPGHGPGRYGLTGRGGAGYVTCEACGAYRQLDEDAVTAIAAAVRQVCGYGVRLSHFPLVGRCPDCQINLNREIHHAHS